MTEPDHYSFPRYLEAKRTVDRRARNRRVEEQFRRALDGLNGPIEICELGTGTGTMVETILEWVSGTSVRYDALDEDPELLDVAAQNVGDDTGLSTGLSGDVCSIEGDGTVVEVEFREVDALAHLETSKDAYDVVVAQSFLDLTDLRATLERIASALRPRGIGYFPITFDGVTSLLPPVDPNLDDRIERRFHRRMDTTEKNDGATGDSNAGRHLLTGVPEAGGELVAAGGSDWVVRSTDDGYEADEAYFLHYIVDTIASSLADDDTIDDERLRDWAERRHEQVADAELVYLAHQLDVLARWPATV